MILLVLDGNIIVSIILYDFLNFYFICKFYFSIDFLVLFGFRMVNGFGLMLIVLGIKLLEKDEEVKILYNLLFM